MPNNNWKGVSVLEERENEYSYNEYEIDLREYIILLWNKKWLILTITITALLLAGIYTFYIAVPVYQTEASLILSNLNNTRALINLEVNGVDYLKNSKARMSNSKYSDVELAIEYLTGNEFMYNNMIDLNGDKLKVSQSRGIDVIKLTIKGSNPEKIYEKLNRVVKVFRDEANQYYNKIISSKRDYLNAVNEEIVDYNNKITAVNKQLKFFSTDIDTGTERLILQTTLTGQLDLYLKQKKNLEDIKYKLQQEIMIYQPVQIINRAIIANSPVNPKKKLNMIIAGLFGLMIAVFVVFFIEFFKGDKN